MFIRGRAAKQLLLFTASTIGILSAGGARASVSYTYDLLGRVTTAVYDNGMCIAYAYDKNGNRTSQTNTAVGQTQPLNWGSGTWGCYYWTHQ